MSWPTGGPVLAVQQGSGSDPINRKQLSPMPSKGPRKERPKPHTTLLLRIPPSSPLSAFGNSHRPSTPTTTTSEIGEMAAELRYMKSLYFGPPPCKVRRTAPRNVLAAVPIFFLFHSKIIFLNNSHQILFTSLVGN
jgi:hypothetical protein